MAGPLSASIEKTIHHSLIFGIGGLMHAGFRLLLVPVYIRHLKADQVGVLALLITVMTLSGVFLRAGINHAFFRFYYDTTDPARRRRSVGTALVTLLAASVSFTGLGFLLSPYLAATLFQSSEIAELFRLTFLIGLIEVLTEIPDAILRATFRSAANTVVTIASYLVQVTLISFLVIFVDPSVDSVLLGRLVGAIAAVTVFYFIVRGHLSLSFSFPLLRELLAFGLPLAFGQLLFTLLVNVDRFFLLRYSSAEAVGAYAIATSLVAMIPILVTTPFGRVWTVMRFFVMDREESAEYYSRVLTYIVFLSMFLSLAVAAVGGDGLLLIADKSYGPGAPLVVVLALAAVFDSASRVLNVGLTLKKRTIYAPLVVLVALTVNVGLNFLLVPRYAAMGASVSLCLSFLVFSVLRYAASNLFFKVSYEWSRLLKIIGIGIALLALFSAIDRLRPADPAQRILVVSMLGKTALALLFPLVLLALRFYEERELRRLSEIVRGLFGSPVQKRDASQ